jgi:hypothetical protein
VAKKRSEEIQHNVELPEGWHEETIHVYPYLNFLGRSLGITHNWEVSRGGQKLEPYSELRQGEQIILKSPKR